MKYHNPNSYASDPGLLLLSEVKLFEIQPELYSLPLWQNLCKLLWERYCEDDRVMYREKFAEHLRFGDSRAAVVVDPEKALVAAYTDELDCVVLLKFDPQLTRQYRWEVGTRLLTVNTYTKKHRKSMAADLSFGTNHLDRYGNFHPLIADLLTDDMRALKERKSRITEDEWARTIALARQALLRPVPPRDGRPMLAGRSSIKEPTE
jgi:hypothetical protein